jgi:hypothetical protein
MIMVKTNGKKPRNCLFLTKMPKNPVGDRRFSDTFLKLNVRESLAGGIWLLLLVSNVLLVFTAPIDLDDVWLSLPSQSTTFC